MKIAVSNLKISKVEKIFILNVYSWHREMCNEILKGNTTCISELVLKSAIPSPISLVKPPWMIAMKSF